MDRVVKTIGAGALGLAGLVNNSGCTEQGEAAAAGILFSMHPNPQVSAGGQAITALHAAQLNRSQFNVQLNTSYTPQNSSYPDAFTHYVDMDHDGLVSVDEFHGSGYTFSRSSIRQIKLGIDLIGQQGKYIDLYLYKETDLNTPVQKVRGVLVSRNDCFKWITLDVADITRVSGAGTYRVNWRIRENENSSYDPVIKSHNVVFVE